MAYSIGFDPSRVFHFDATLFAAISAAYGAGDDEGVKRLWDDAVRFDDLRHENALDSSTKM